MYCRTKSVTPPASLMAVSYTHLAMAAPAAGAAAPAAEEKTEFDVVRAGFDAAQKIKVIKVVREITGLGLSLIHISASGWPADPGPSG